MTSSIRGIASLPRSIPAPAPAGLAQLQRATFLPAADNPDYADRLAEFNRLQAAGVDGRDLWEQTGIYASAATGGVPVYEIPDNNADFVGGTPPVTGPGYNPMGESFDHPELYAAHPRSADVNLQITDQTPDSTRRGYFRPGSLRDAPTVGLSLDEGDMDKTSARSILLHENQHFVANETVGMPGGADPRTLTDVAQYLNLNYPDWRNLVPEDRQLTDAQLSTIRMNPDPGLTEDNVYTYLFSPGEALARATQSRMDLTADERIPAYPGDSLDVPIEGVEMYLDAYRALRNP